MPGAYLGSCQKTSYKSPDQGNPIIIIIIIIIIVIIVIIIITTTIIIIAFFATIIIILLIISILCYGSRLYQLKLRTETM